MSDQATFGAFIEALNAHTKALNAFLAANKGGAAPAGGKATAEKETSKPAGGKKKVTKEQLAEAFGAYLSVKDKDEKKERAGNVKAMSDHYGVERISLIDESDYAAALAYLKQFENGETPDFMNEEEGEGDDASLV